MFRHDLGTSTTVAHDCGTGARLGQPALADEWLVVLSRHGAKSELIVFDSGDLAAGPRSVVRLPVTVPVAARTTWQPVANLSCA